MERACDSSVLESWSCWTGASGGCWPYVSVMVKPGTNQKKHSSARNTIVKPKNAKKAAFTNKDCYFLQGVSPRQQAPRTPAHRQEPVPSTHPGWPQAHRRAVHMATPPSRPPPGHRFSATNYVQNRHQWGFPDTLSRPHTAHAHTHTRSPCGRLWGWRPNTAEGPAVEGPRPGDGPETPVWDPPLTLRQAGRLEGLLRRGWLFELVHVCREGGRRSHKPV